MEEKRNHKVLFSSKELKRKRQVLYSLPLFFDCCLYMRKIISAGEPETSSLKVLAENETNVAFAKSEGTVNHITAMLSSPKLF